GARRVPVRRDRHVDAIGRRRRARDPGDEIGDGPGPASSFSGSAPVTRLGAGHGTGGQLVAGGASRTATNWFTASTAPRASAHHGRSVPSLRRTANRRFAGSPHV